MKKPLLIVITGPTASGKSALAISLAKKLNADIISADSRQIYTGIPIVTAVPSLEEREGVKHHLLEILPLDAYYSAARFQEDAMGILNNIYKNQQIAIMCGGSMLYLDSLLNGIDELPTVPSEIREGLTVKWKENGDEWLLDLLKNTDPDYYFKVDRSNLKRVFHAIEISLTAGKAYSSLLSHKTKVKNPDLPFEVIKFCLSGDRNFLFDKINNRVLSMLENGLEKEAESVYPLRHLNSLNTVGLKELFLMFDGVFSRNEAISKIQKNTRVYAKKQLTWHKQDKDLKYLDFSEKVDYNSDKIIPEIGHLYNS